VIFLDFEFNKTVERRLNLVAGVVLSGKTLLKTDLTDIVRRGRFRSVSSKIFSGQTLCSFNVLSEARSLSALGLNPLDYQWIDLFLEYRCLLNNHDKLSYGKQYIDGRELVTHNPIYKSYLKGKDLRFDEPPDSLAGAIYKLLGIKIDVKKKNKLRDIILSNNKFTYEQMRAIKNYCYEDVKYLEPLFKAILQEYKDRGIKIDDVLKKEMHSRAEYAVRTSIIEDGGYPINVEATKNFSNSVQDILNECRVEINSLFPEVTPFEYSPGKEDYTLKQGRVKCWIEKTPFAEKWEKTERGSLSLALDSFTRFYDFKHDFPSNNFGAQMVRFLKLKQSLNGFMPLKEGAKRKSFWESVGKDGRVRPYLNIYRSQTSRNQPSSTGFIPLKSAWMRSLIQPKTGMTITGIDFSSEEFLIAALLSNDENMIKAYESGDVYLFFGKEAGAIPPNGTKQEYKKERDKFKSTTLGIQYDMGSESLANKLSQDTGETYSVDDAQELINMFNEIFPVYKEWKENIVELYSEQKYLKLFDGWYMWGSNPNYRSVGNFPVQGMGGVILREAVRRSQMRGLKIIYTLHDAIYIEHPSNEERHRHVLASSMIYAFSQCFPGNFRAKVRLDGNTWSPDYPEEQSEFEYWGVKYKKQKIYVDERAKEEYKKFSKYFIK
jgi:hypothetical protein